MGIVDKEFYNRNSASKLGWLPSWFGDFENTDFNEELTEAIAKWQKANGLEDDGLCGPSTYKKMVVQRKVATEKEAEAAKQQQLSGKHFYNQSSSEKLGWKPDWFGEGLEDFDDQLLEAIKKWQADHDLKADGLCGPGTFRHLWTAREDEISKHEPVIIKRQQHIVHNGNFTPIKWDKVVLWTDEGGYECKEGTYSSYAGKPDRKPHYFVNHWDVCKSTKSMAKVIAKRGISIHFGIDLDGTIYQLLDTQHAAWQAGKRLWNHDSIGVEICNPYYEKYQDKDNPRPVIKDGEVHGTKMKPFMGFYPVQIEALTALWAAIHEATGIPLEVPLEDNGEQVKGVDSRCEASKFSGFINHYNLTRRKIDCAYPSLDMVEILKNANGLVE